MHHHTVLYDRGEHIVHIDNRLNDSRRVHRSRKIKKENVTPTCQGKCRLQFLARNAGKDRIRLFARPVELSAQHTLEIHVLFHILGIPTAQRLDTELGIVTVHDRDIISHYVMKITGKKHRHGGLAHAAFLTAHGDKDTSFAHRLPNDWLIIVLLSRPFLITPAPCTDGFPYHETVMSSRKHSRPAGPKPCRKNAGRLSADTVPFSRGPDISGACHEKLSYLQYDLPFSS